MAKGKSTQSCRADAIVDDTESSHALAAREIEFTLNESWR
jgi:hypothetical protein